MHARGAALAGGLEHGAHLVELGDQRIALDGLRRAHEVGDPHLDPVRVDGVDLTRSRGQFCDCLS
jgi:hypothetical protein